MERQKINDFSILKQKILSIEKIARQSVQEVTNYPITYSSKICALIAQAMDPLLHQEGITAIPTYTFPLEHEDSRVVMPHLFFKVHWNNRSFVVDPTYLQHVSETERATLDDTVMIIEITNAEKVREALSNYKIPEVIQSRYIKGIFR